MLQIQGNLTPGVTVTQGRWVSGPGITVTNVSLSITSLPVMDSQYYQLKCDKSIWLHSHSVVISDPGSWLIVAPLSLRRMWPGHYNLNRDYQRLRHRVLTSAHSGPRAIERQDFNVITLPDIEKKGLFPCFRCGMFFEAVNSSDIYYCRECHRKCE